MFLKGKSKNKFMARIIRSIFEKIQMTFKMNITLPMYTKIYIPYMDSSISLLRICLKMTSFLGLGHLYNFFNTVWNVEWCVFLLFF